MRLITKKRCLMQQVCWIQFAHITNTWSELWVETYHAPIYPMVPGTSCYHDQKQGNGSFDFCLAAATIQRTITCDSDHLDKQAFCL